MVVRPSRVCARPAVSEGEAEVVARALSGDTAACARLVVEHGPGLRRVLASRLVDSHLVEDVAQDVWVLAFRRLGTFRGEARFAAWLRRIAVREAGRALERRRAERSRVREMGWDGVMEYADGEPGPWGRLAARDQVRVLLAGLPRRELEAYVLTAIGWSYGEVAERLGSPMGSVATWVHRARRRLEGVGVDG